MGEKHITLKERNRRFAQTERDAVEQRAVE
jgi:hypothetical protein